MIEQRDAGALPGNSTVPSSWRSRQGTGHITERIHIVQEVRHVSSRSYSSYLLNNFICSPDPKRRGMNPHVGYLSLHTAASQPPQAFLLFLSFLCFFLFSPKASS